MSLEFRVRHERIKLHALILRLKRKEVDCPICVEKYAPGPNLSKTSWIRNLMNLLLSSFMSFIFVPHCHQFFMNFYGSFRILEATKPSWRNAASKSSVGNAMLDSQIPQVGHGSGVWPFTQLGKQTQFAKMRSWKPWQNRQNYQLHLLYNLYDLITYLATLWHACNLAKQLKWQGVFHARSAVVLMV